MPGAAPHDWSKRSVDTLTVGNAAEDSAQFRHWLVGDIASWTRSDGNPIDLPRAGLRNTKDVEIKWGIHPAGEARADGWVGSSGKRAVSILLRGRFNISFRDGLNPAAHTEVCLSRQGDYVLWGEQHEHDWRAVEDSLVLTVRWTPRTAPP